MFETKLSFKTVLFYSANSLAIMLLWLKVIFSGKDYWLGILVSFLALIMFCYSLKTFKITETALIVRKPFWILKSEDIYLLNEISKIKLEFEKARLSGGPKFIIIKNNLKEDYLIYYFGKELKELINQLEMRNVEIEKDKYFENQLT